MIFITLLTVAQPVLAEPVKILPFGTWTAGLDGRVSYRYDLWFNLIDAGFDVDFVGSQNAPGGGVNMNLYPDYSTGFDRDHEGREATLSSDMVVLGKRASATYDPDIVLLWAGPYDLLTQGAGGVANARFAIPDVIEGIRQFTPGVTILLALCSHAEPLEAAHVDALNDAITTIASEMNTPESPIIVVDHVTGFSPTSMMYDQHHHNRVGEAWVAENWFEVLADILPTFESFQINAGHSGAWYNPQTSGQGQLIDVVPEDQFMFLAWFTFTDAASNNPDQQHWYTAQGNYSGNTAELVLSETLGGQFDDLQQADTNPVGTVTVSFSDCEQGQMAYSIDTDGRQGTIPLQRLIPGSGDICEGHSGQAAITTDAVDINAGMDGAWLNEDTPGQGFLIDAHPNEEGGNFIFVAWFTYGDHTASGQRWLTAQGDFSGSIAAIDVWETTGGSFDDPQAVNPAKVGTMNLDFTDCSNAQLSYSLTDEGLANDMAISRLIPGGQALCEELAGAE
jgi:hypothetical protein